MTRATALLVGLTLVAGVATAQVNIKASKRDERQRTTELTALLKDSAKHYKGIKITKNGERDALFELGKKLSADRLKYESLSETLTKRVEELDSMSPEDVNYFTAVAEARKELAELTNLAESMEELISLAERAYGLSKSYEPPQRDRAEWKTTWRTVERFLPKHLYLKKAEGEKQ